MQAFIQHIARQRPDGLHTILVVGAAGSAGIQDWRKLASKRLLLVEAHPRLASELAHHIDATRGEEVWPLAITPVDQPGAVLHTFNNPRFSSVQDARDLTRHYPSLRPEGDIKVAARGFADVARQAGLSTAAGNLLVLAAPGQAHTLIAAAEAPQLQQFEWIIVRASRVPLYDGDDAEACLASLARIGFDLIQEDPYAIHPERLVLLKRNEARVRILALDAQVHQVAEERDQQATLANERKAEIDKLAVQLKQQADEHQKQLKALTNERDQQATLANERKAQIDKLAVQLKQQADEHQKQLKALTNERDQQATLANERKAEAERLLNESREREASLQTELATARQTSGLSIRLQTLREADLKDLQERYQTLLGQYESQRDLLLKLNEKLSAASNYFHSLAASDEHAGKGGANKTRSTRITSRKSASSDG